MNEKNKLTPSRVPNMSGNIKTPVKKKQSGNGVLKNKLFLFIFMPLIVIISGITVFFIIRAMNNGEALPVSGNENYVYVLPMSERSSENNTKDGKNPFAATGLAPLVLEGIMYNPDGTSYAVLKSTSTTYVKSTGEEIGETGWTLTGITETTVTVAKDDLTEVLSFAMDASSLDIQITPSS